MSQNICVEMRYGRTSGHFLRLHSRYCILNLIIGVFVIYGLFFGTNLVSGADSGVVPIDASLPHAPVMMLTPSTPRSKLAGLKNNDVVELQNGRRLKVGTLRKFSSLARKLKAARATYPAMPAAVKKQPASTGLKITRMAELSKSLEKSADTTIQFPSGRSYTVTQLRFLRPFLEVELGKKMNQSWAQSRYQGKAIQLKNRTDDNYWKSILTQPEETVLETPQGGRFTVGELKSFIGQGYLSQIPSAPSSGGKK